jgi:UDP-3-O-[3-hydroxymyristoyl] glucosamine N-acyltransferase
LCVIGEDARIEVRAILRGGNHVGAGSVVGEETELFPNVLLYPRTQLGRRVRIHAGTTVGSDGFGYVLDSGLHRKVPQVGNVIVHDDVEIGANVTIDRGALGPTVIGRGTKIDNLVQIAHNCIIGRGCIICGVTGIAGSVKMGDGVTIGGSCGIADAIEIGDRAMLGAKSGLMHDLPAGESWLGYPAQPARSQLRTWSAVRALPDLLRAMKKNLSDSGSPSASKS